jgi:4-amino-4-deoxy-L-arabinose transferase-like glycosyltransferase
MLFVYQDPGKTVGDSHLLRSSDFVSRVISHTQPFFFLFLVFIALSSPWTFFLPLLLIVLQFRDTSFLRLTMGDKQCSTQVVLV